MRESRQPPALAVDEAFADFLAGFLRRSIDLAPVTLVAIDANSLADHAWPWTPLDFALFFQSANSFGPEIAATDEVLAWNRKTMSPEKAQTLPQYEKLLREHLLRAPMALLGARLGLPDDPQSLPALEEVPVLRNIKGDPGQIAEFTAVEAKAAEAFRLSSAMGFINLPAESRKQRAVPLVLRYRGQVVPTFVLQAILLWEKLNPDEVMVEPGVAIRLADRGEIPINSQGWMRVDFGVPFSVCGFDELVLASAQLEASQPPMVKPELLTKRLLLLSRTDPAAQTLALASRRTGSRGELFASAIATIQARSFIRRMPAWVELVTIGGMMLLALLIPSWNRRVTAGVLAACVGGYVVMAVLCFRGTMLWMPLTVPAGLAVLLILFRLVMPDRPLAAAEQATPRYSPGT